MAVGRNSEDSVVGHASTVVAVHREAANLVDAVGRVTGRVPEHHLHDEWGDYPWTLAEELGLLTLLGRLSASQLEEWRAGHRRVVGVSTGQEVRVQDMVHRSRERDRESLIVDVRNAWQELYEQTHALSERHLRCTVTDIIRGREPLITWLIAEVFELGRQRIDEITRILDEIEVLWPTRCSRPAEGGLSREAPDVEETA